MNDLVQRLRTDPPKHKPVIEAAREIERLRSVIADFESSPGWREYRAENKRLTAERDMLVDALDSAGRAAPDGGYIQQICREALAAVEKTK